MKGHKPSATAIIAVLALVLALGGTAAASGYVITRLGQIKPSVRNALKGNRGPRGFTGAQGAQGAAGVVPQIQIVESPHYNLAPGQTTYDVDPNATYKASCPPGYTVVGTGFNDGIGQVDDVLDYGGFFVGGFFYNNTSITITVYVQAMCGAVPGGSIAAARDLSGLQRAGAQYRADVQRLGAAKG